MWTSNPPEPRVTRPVPSQEQLVRAQQYCRGRIDEIQAQQRAERAEEIRQYEALPWWRQLFATSPYHSGRGPYRLPFLEILREQWWRPFQDVSVLCGRLVSLPPGCTVTLTARESEWLDVCLKGAQQEVPDAAT